MDKYEVLKSCFGYDDLREGQAELIDNILSGKDTLGVMPTGAGKSLCYQIPALMMDGVSLVISPLISLMQDQVMSLVGLGIKAAYINSSLTQAQYHTVLRRAAEGWYKLIYVAPERLDSETFLQTVCSMDISMVTTDEAHCISHWGQDFRPSYLKIPEFIAKLPRRPVVTAFTATATEQVRDDIIRLLDMRSPFMKVTGFDRKNLYFEVRHPEDKFHDLLSLVRKYDAEGRSGIIYCSTRKDVENVCDKLRDEGFSVSRYHAGLTENERRNNQEDLIYDRVRVMVATNAFGMGIDKSNISFVIHYGMPKDVESYYQEAGRAGRDGSPSDCILLYTPRDRYVAEFLINKSYEESSLDPEEAERIRERDMTKLRDMVRYAVRDGCLRSYILRYFGETGMDNCGNCSYCCGDVALTDITTDAQKIMSCIFRSGQRYSISTVAKILTGDSGESVTGRGLDTLSTYGIMAGSSVKYIYGICSRLCEMDHITISDDDHRIAKLTEKALPVLRGEIRVNARIRADKVRERTAKYDRNLFLILQDIRAKAASVAGVPPYSIFTDLTLAELAAKMPTDTESFARIPGVTRIKIERYADRFIRAISEYNSKKRGTKVNDISMLLMYTDKYKASEKTMTITAFCESIIESSGCSVRAKHVRDAVTGWLISRDLLAIGTDADGKNTKIVTGRSSDVGIISEHRTGVKGKEYDIVLYTAAAQQFIIDNMADIVKFSQEVDK
ncbi:MAG: DNA helicase RecQ [Oscillospiraceae bacterium]|nr:DNA helicase RecQ [Oscillospiraceae bacterium]